MNLKALLFVGIIVGTSVSCATPSPLVGSWLSDCRNDAQVFDKNGNLVPIPATQAGSSRERTVISTNGNILSEAFNYTGANCTGHLEHTPFAYRDLQQIGRG